MTLYYYMHRSWQDCCRRGENRSWPSVSVESVDNEYWCLNNAIVYAFRMRLTVEERVLRSTFKLNTLYIYSISYVWFLPSASSFFKLAYDIIEIQVLWVITLYLCLACILYCGCFNLFCNVWLRVGALTTVWVFC